eukprot:6458770-Amphidinium_carterae.1
MERGDFFCVGNQFAANLLLKLCTGKIYEQSATGYLVHRHLQQVAFATVCIWVIVSKLRTQKACADNSIVTTWSRVFKRAARSGCDEPGRVCDSTTLVPERHTNAL